MKLIQMIVKGILEKIYEIDKQKHIAVSFILMMISLCFFSIVPSIIFTITIGLAKEIWDKNYGSGFCWYDMLANGLGVVIALILFELYAEINRYGFSI
jgi:hypothetical protein